jgi:hypothetical protein
VSAAAFTQVEADAANITVRKEEEGPEEIRTDERRSVGCQPRGPPTPEDIAMWRAVLERLLLALVISQHSCVYIHSAFTNYWGK